MVGLGRTVHPQQAVDLAAKGFDATAGIAAAHGHVHAAGRALFTQGHAVDVETAALNETNQAL